MEEFFEKLPVFFNLFGKFLRRVNGGQGIVVRHCQKVHASGFRQILESGNQVRPVVQGLFQNDSAERQSKTEFAPGEFNKLFHQPGCREVTALRHRAEHAGIQIIIFIKGVFSNFEEVIMNQPVGLMSHESEGNVAHGRRGEG